MDIKKDDYDDETELVKNPFNRNGSSLSTIDLDSYGSEASVISGTSRIYESFHLLSYDDQFFIISWVLYILIGIISFSIGLIIAYVLRHYDKTNYLMLLVFIVPIIIFVISIYLIKLILDCRRKQEYVDTFL